MIYSIKLLAYALLAALPAWWTTRLLLRQAIGAKEFNRAWLLILAITAISFLSRSSGVFIALIFSLLAVAAASERGSTPNLIAVYSLVWVAAPPASFSFSNIGDIGQFFDLTAPRVACLVLLPIAAQQIVSSSPIPKWLRTLDGFTIALIFLKLLQSSQESSSLHLVRQSVVAVIDTALPYYVITRGFKDTFEVQRLVAWTALGATYVAFVAMLEFGIQKNIYVELQGIFGQLWQLTLTITRGSYLRVQATTAQPILLGMLLVFGGALIWMQLPDRNRRGAFWLILLAFVGALLATFSRGPMLGALIYFSSWWLLNQINTRLFRILVLGSVLGLISLRWTGMDSVLISSVSQLLGGGAEGAQTADYRQELLDTGLALIAQSPWWGVPDYAAHMQNLKQGEGIIDMVNTYIAVTLDMGLVGLALYLGPILVVAHQLLNHLQQPELRADPQARMFLTSCVALICAFLAIIFTTSIYGIASYLMLLLVALPAAWMHAHGKSVAPPMAKAYGRPLAASRGLK
ncbi:O-antigen ligase family protein [Ideonella sp.]|uniref:O-antigen ligase family protein n=1 Tax=Ideonella sp. TaxID=1929293 RepID=UPI003BB6B050